MSILFESYELDFANYVQKINKIFRDFNQCKTKEKEQSILDIEKIIQQFKQCIQQMEQEAKESKNKEQEKKTKKYKQQSDEQNKKFQKMHESYKRNKQKLKLFGGSENRNIEKETREQLINNSGNLENQKQQFGKLNRMAQETEHLTLDMQGNLAKQREVLLKNNQIGKDINQEMTRTDRLLTQMRNREIMNKLILVALIFFITLTNILVIFIKIKRYLKTYE